MISLLLLMSGDVINVIKSVILFCANTDIMLFNINNDTIKYLPIIY